MAIKTQGTHLYAIDTDGTTVLTVALKSISGVSASKEQLETTELDMDARTYVAGLATPGAATFEVQFDPANTTHTTLHTRYKAGDVLKWAIGWADGTAAPTATAGAWTLPTTRSFLDFDGYISDFPFQFDLNSIVTSSISLQISGFPTLTPKA